MTESNVKTPLLGGKKPPLSRPKYQRRRSSFEASTYNSAGKSLSYSKSAQDEDTTIPGLTLWKILTLTICMAGVQFTCKHIYRKKLMGYS
jgi:solute carrier family 45 protein 1/2/4